MANLAVPIGRREAGKAERRARIIQAARDLIRDTGDAGLSMRALAARAGVSLATPYNLFGSKRAIVLAVLQDVREFIDRFSNLPAADPLERIFATVDLSISYYVADPRFYRTLWSTVFDTADEVRGEVLSPQRDAFWRSLVMAAAEAGVIEASVNLDLLQRQLDFILRAAMLDWVVGEIKSDSLAPTIRLGYGLILCGAATESWRKRLQDHIQADQSAVLAAKVKP